MECLVFVFLKKINFRLQTGNIHSAVQVALLQISKHHRGTERLLVFQVAENKALVDRSNIRNCQ